MCKSEFMSGDYNRKFECAHMCHINNEEITSTQIPNIINFVDTTNILSCILIAEW